jgi:hypothetical protein
LVDSVWVRHPQRSAVDSSMYPRRVGYPPCCVNSPRSSLALSRIALEDEVDDEEDDGEADKQPHDVPGGPAE